MLAPQFHCSYRTFSADHLANKAVTVYLTDLSGKKSYRFNSIGFRGADYNPHAKRSIYVFGCSYTFGIGLNEDELWCHHLHRNYCALHGLQPDEVNLMNFGLPGGSNQEIARTALLQCSVKPPDLAVVQFTLLDRYELIRGDGILMVGSWTTKDDWIPSEYKEQATNRYEYYEPEEGSLDLIKQALSVQHFFAAKKIDYLTAGIIFPTHVTKPTRALMRLIDRPRMLWVSSKLQQLRLQKKFFCETEPRAADDSHAGPTVQATCASFAWERYLSLERTRSRIRSSV